ncbi:MAG: hypothetical protein WA755_12130 [Candidatus Acidiferrales bacterium]
MRTRNIGYPFIILALAGFIYGCAGKIIPEVSPAPPATAPTIVTTPANQSVVAGQPATFSVVANGTAPLSYQWQQMVNGTVSNINGAMSSSYTISSTTMQQNGNQFAVTVSNAAGNIMSTWAILSVTAVATAPMIQTEPQNVTVTAGQPATFSVTATGTAPLSYQWEQNVNGTITDISGATSSSYIIASTTMQESGNQFAVTVSNTAGNATSGFALLTVNASGTSGTDVVTYHNDLSRSGLNSTESALTTTNVDFHTFGLLGSLAADGLVDAEPLYLSALTVGGVSQNVVFVATENDSVYAYNADTEASLWHDTPQILLEAGESPSDDRGCGQVTPTIGITSTPVIDRSAGPNGLIFVVTMSKDGSGNYHQRIHALDVTTGAEMLGGPTEIVATYPGTGAGSSNGTQTFNPAQYKDRAALLLLNGVVYTTWASHCDNPDYSAWIIGYNESTLKQSVVFNLTANGANTANGQYGSGSIWHSGGGPAADSQGNIYVAVANGAFETTLNASGFPSQGDYGNAFVKLSTANNSLAVVDYFNMSNTVSESDGDTDLGSGGPMLLPDLTDTNGNTHQLAVAAGKDGNMYIVDRTNMGKFSSTSNNIYQELSGALPGGVWGVPAYFNDTVFYCPQGGALSAFSISNAQLSSSPAKTGASFTYPGLLPSVSANGTSNGIIWGVENTSTAVLRAFDAGNFPNELYNSNQAPSGADQFGGGNKYVTPMIANGKVFVGTPNSVAVFGLLTSSR